jgi:hypothetical protein
MLAASVLRYTPRRRLGVGRMLNSINCRWIREAVEPRRRVYGALGSAVGEHRQRVYCVGCWLHAGCILKADGCGEAFGMYEYIHLGAHVLVHTAAATPGNARLARE